jgi:hypothetical protein
MRGYSWVRRRGFLTSSVKGVNCWVGDICMMVKKLE